MVEQQHPDGAGAGVPGRAGATAPGTAADFRERLWPSPRTWLLVPLAVAFGAATGSIGGTGWAVAAGLATAAVVVGVLVSASAVVALGADGVLHAGRAHVGVEHLTGAMAARGADARALRGPRLDARTHLCLRGWVGPVVLVGLGDPQDPTPSWLVSTRRPEALVAALASHGVSGPVAVHRSVDSSTGGALPGGDGTVPRPELGPDRGTVPER